MREATYWIGTSWKMNKSLAEAMAFSDMLSATDTGSDERVQRFVIPPFTTMRQVKERLMKTSVKVGAQNMHWEDAGAWTGEISPPMLKDCNLDLVELGHSERREFFNETDETVGRKTAAAVRHGLIPLICIGDTRAEYMAGQTDAILKRQVEAALAFLEGAERRKTILIAYEPVWAIGVNGIPASADFANERQAMIASVARAVLGVKVPVLYGGSVSAENCAELITQPHIDGLFIGRSAWQPAGYLNILERVAKALG
ncbi:triose-phosphate isomerase [Agrobacterium tumefaciens]|uniref:triose-phosphate isomerase n=1 Tax=Agrobacterium tumefaciens TaxID=358 RepID=UPI003850413A